VGAAEAPAVERRDRGAVDLEQPEAKPAAIERRGGEAGVEVARRPRRQRGAAALPPAAVVEGAEGREARLQLAGRSDLAHRDLALLGEGALDVAQALSELGAEALDVGLPGAGAEARDGQLGAAGDAQLQVGEARGELGRIETDPVEDDGPGPGLGGS